MRRMCIPEDVWRMRRMCIPEDVWRMGGCVEDEEDVYT